MKKLILLVCLFIANFSLLPSTLFSDSKVLVVFFSRADENYGVGVVKKGNTQVLAEFISENLKADLFHIETLKPYPKKYKECTDVALKEKKGSERPKLLKNIGNLGDYDVVFLGYPIWWGDLPMAVYTFLESNGFKGKLIVPFCTHEGSGHSQTKERIEKVCAGAKVLSVFAMKGQNAQKLDASTKKEVLAWLDEVRTSRKDAQ